MKRNEGVVVVTYSTMSCSGLPVSGARLTDHSWPSGRQRNTGWGRDGGEEGRARGEGSLAQAVYMGGHSAQLLAGAFLLSISQPLRGRLVFSSAVNCPDCKTQFRKMRNPPKWPSQQISCMLVGKIFQGKCSPGSSWVSKSPPPPPATTHSPRGLKALWQ